MKPLIGVTLLAVMVSSHAFGWGAVQGRYGGAAYRGPAAACCMDPEFRRTRPSSARGQAMRTEIGRPSSSMRLSA